MMLPTIGGSKRRTEDDTLGTACLLDEKFDSEDEGLVCSVCRLNFDENKRCPRSLPCGHTFCLECITNLFKLDKIKCPIDRRKHRFRQGVNYVPRNFVLLEAIKKLKKKPEFRCLECSEDMSKDTAMVHRRWLKRHRILRIKDASDHTEFTSAYRSGICDEHKLPYTLYDEFCRKTLCSECYTTSHIGHAHVSIKNSARRPRASVDEFVRAAEDLVMRLKSSKAALQHINLNIQQDYLDEVADIDQRVSQVFNTLVKSASAYKMKLSNLVEKQRQLVSRRDSQVQARIEVTEKALAKARFLSTCTDSVFVAQAESIKRFKDVNTDNQKFETSSSISALDNFGKNLELARRAVKSDSKNLKRKFENFLGKSEKDEVKLVPGMKVLARVKGKYQTCYISSENNERYLVQAPQEECPKVWVDGGNVIEWRPEHLLKIQLFIKTPFAGLVVVSVRFDAKVENVKDIMFAKARSKGEVWHGHGRLSYCSKLLEGHKDLIFYGIDDQATLTYQTFRRPQQGESVTEIPGNLISRRRQQGESETEVPGDSGTVSSEDVDEDEDEDEDDDIEVFQNALLPWGSPSPF